MKYENDNAGTISYDDKLINLGLFIAAFLLLLFSVYSLAGVFFGLSDDSKNYIKKASASIAESEKQSTSEQKIVFLCEALSSTGRALARDPHNGRYLMAWAHLRSLLESTQCPNPYTVGDSNAALQESLALSPLDPEVLISGAQLLSLQGKEKESWSLIQRALIFDQHLDAAERRSIAALLKTTDAVQATMPAQFPQVVVWSHYLTDSASPSIRNLVSSLQQKALQDLHTSVIEGRMPISIARSHLNSLYQIPIEDSVRQIADSISAEVYRKDNIWNVYRYLDYRKKLQIVPKVVGYNVYDKNPENSSLTYWGNTARVTLTNPKFSLGFVMKEPIEIRFLELELHSGSKPIPINLLKVFISKDNMLWQEIGVSGSPLVATIGEKLHQGLTLPEGVKSRYWKITYSGDNKSQASVQLPEGVIVYSQKGSA